MGFKDDEDAENPDGFGFDHYALNHNISDRRVIGEAIEKGSRVRYSKHPDAYGDRWNYLIKVYNTNLHGETGQTWVENILVGVSLDFDYKHHELKDAMPLGVVTAFCPRTSRKVNGVSKCPLFVNDGAWTFDGEGNISHPGLQ